MNLLVTTTIGGTKYLKEWLENIKLLNPSKIVVARDLDRCESTPYEKELTFIDYQSNKKWDGYDRRHIRWESDYSICMGIIKTMQYFLASSFTHYLHIDSDVMIDDGTIRRILNYDWEIINIVIPVIPRDAPTTTKPEKTWDSTNFGISRAICQMAVGRIERMFPAPNPVDIKINKIFESFKKRQIKVDSPNLSHYVYGRKIYNRDIR